MVRSLRRSPLLLVFLLSVTLALLLLFQGGYLNAAEAAAMRVLAPLERVATSIAARAARLVDDSRDLRDLQERHRALEKLARELLIEN
ncbi:MAG: hypothetical protein ACUVST_10285, partial [Anaerolineae bacterium]